MNKSHMIIDARFAMSRNAQGELVQSIDSVTGEQDINVAGTLVSIKSNAIEYTRADGSVGTAYQGRTLVNNNGTEKEVPVLINGSAIESVIIGQTYWLTERVSKDGLYSNYTQGSLSAEPAVDASVARNRRALMLAKLALVTPAVAPIAIATGTELVN